MPSAMHDVFAAARSGDAEVGVRGVAVPLMGRDGERGISGYAGKISTVWMTRRRFKMRSLAIVDVRSGNSTQLWGKSLC
jgi:hypothetical protein